VHEIKEIWLLDLLFSNSERHGGESIHHGWLLSDCNRHGGESFNHGWLISLFKGLLGDHIGEANLLLGLLDGDPGKNLEWALLHLLDKISLLVLNSLDLIDGHLSEQFLESELWLGGLNLLGLSLLHCHLSEEIHKVGLCGCSTNKSSGGELHLKNIFLLI